MTTTSAAIWAICALATLGVLVRPFRWPEAVWAGLGAIALVLFGLLPAIDAGRAVGKGLDVYLFLVGMMLLSETARREGLFDWVAALAVSRSDHSPARLFLLVYGVGVIVTTFLSNDATAVVLTPAVFAATRKAKAEPLPYLFICAFIANAASFVLPISNPANLVLFGDHTPPLARWMAGFALPSLISVAITYAALRWTQRKALAGSCECDVERPRLSVGGRAALVGIAFTGVVLLVVSALDIELGAPTCAMGVLATLAVVAINRSSPLPIMKGVAWSILPLVAGWFVMVEALDRSGLTRTLAALMRSAASISVDLAAATSGLALAFTSNLVNNLPAGLVASAAITQAQPPHKLVDVLLIGVDLGPNLSMTGSLATILWLTAIRREGEEVSFLEFLRIGAIVMPPALVLAIAMRLAAP